MLKLDIEEIREAIRVGRFTNEAAVSQGVVLRILHALSWPTYDTQIVSPEYSVEGRRVDFALCHPAGKPAVFIEVKGVGQSDATGERQLFEYAFHKGVPMAILTDGQEWQFFLPAEQGDYGERRVYKLDISASSIRGISSKCGVISSIGSIASATMRSSR
jgi:predicted type IV restriction endonuclease